MKSLPIFTSPSHHACCAALTSASVTAFFTGASAWPGALPIRMQPSNVAQKTSASRDRHATLLIIHSSIVFPTPRTGHPRLLAADPGGLVSGADTVPPASLSSVGPDAEVHPHRRSMAAVALEV